MDDLAAKYTEKAEKLKNERKFEEALKLRNKIKEIEEEKRAPDYWYKRGIHYSEVGEYEKALECYNKDLDLHEKSYDVFFEKGKILLYLKKYSDSLESLNKAAEIRNQHYLQSSKKAQHMKNARKFEKALLYEDKAFNEKSLNEIFWYYKGAVLLKLKKYSDARLCFKNSIMIKENLNSLYDLAKCLLFCGDENECINILMKAVQKDSRVKEKLKVDIDFISLENNKQFRTIVGL